MICLCREAAGANGLDEFLKHVGSHSTSPGFTRQADLILQHWQELDLKASNDEASMSDADSQADDDPEDQHSHAAETMDAAESIHSYSKHQCKQNTAGLNHERSVGIRTLADVSQPLVLLSICRGRAA